MKKLIWSILTVALVIGLAGGGAAAYFLDTETSTGNSFTAGTYDLKLSDRNESFGDGVAATWTMTNMAPGASTVGTYFVNLQNAGTVDNGHVEMAFTHQIDEGVPVESETNINNTAAQMARFLEIVRMDYDTIDFTDPYTDENGNGYFDLEDLTLGHYLGAGGLLDNLPAPPANNTGTTSLSMKLKFNAGAGNDFQGDTLNTTVTFTLNQDTSQ
jgi:spore coat-associated protein N